MSSNRLLDDVGSYVLPSIYTFVTHPLTHARILMQLGYEPAPKYLGHTVLSALGIGDKVYKYPSVFTYCKYMKNEIGLLGIFTIGLPSRIIYWNVSTCVSDIVLNEVKKYGTSKRYMDTDVNFDQFFKSIAMVTLSRSISVCVAYPFQVLMVRQMAEIMNEGPKQSRWMIRLALDILDDEGIRGLYGGLMAKLIGEVTVLWMTAGLIYVLNRYVLKDIVGPDFKEYTPTLGGLICSHFTYRYSVISTVMSLSGSKISGSKEFGSVMECYSYLSERKALARGSSLLLRYK